MPKKLFKRWSPDPAKIKKNPALKFFGVLLHDPYLFHLNRHSVSVAFFVGLFIAFIPVPGQVPLAAFAAFLFRCNLPISVALVWVSNPLTYPVILYAAYKLGAAILNLPEESLHIEMSWQWLHSEFVHIWQPMLLGCFLASILFSCGGYLFIQWSWRWHVVKRWQERKIMMQKKRYIKRNSPIPANNRPSGARATSKHP